MNKRIRPTGVFLLVLLTAIFLMTGCDGTQVIFGTVTFSASSNAKTCRIYLVDHDGNDLSSQNYLKRSVYVITGSDTSVDFIIDTTGVPAGSYYLLGAIANDVNPDSESGWFSYSWYGGGSINGPTPPDSANIKNLNNQEFNFTLESTS